MIVIFFCIIGFIVTMIAMWFIRKIGCLLAFLIVIFTLGVIAYGAGIEIPNEVSSRAS